jgi:hypothetical protein
MEPLLREHPNGMSSQHILKLLPIKHVGISTQAISKVAKRFGCVNIGRTYDTMGYGKGTMIWVLPDTEAAKRHLRQQITPEMASKVEWEPL